MRHCHGCKSTWDTHNLYSTCPVCASQNARQATAAEIADYRVKWPEFQPTDTRDKQEQS